MDSQKFSEVKMGCNEYEWEDVPAANNISFEPSRYLKQIPYETISKSVVALHNNHKEQMKITKRMPRSASFKVEVVGINGDYFANAGACQF